jgi:hypothetical protein
MSVPKIGDVVEIVSKRGFAYAQYTQHHPEWNAVLRVFDRVFGERPSDWAMVVSLPVRFIVQFPLRSAVRQKAISVVGHAPVTPKNLDFPIFRRGMADPATGKVHRWWLWHGEGDYAPNLPLDKMRALSDHRSVDIEFLEHLIDSDWSPQREWDEKNARS